MTDTLAPSPPTSPPDSRRRWLVLGVLCASVFVVVLDGTIINVALPTLATELGATTSQLQWIVDSYVLVFAGLLMAAGSLGDRVGRKGLMQIGLALFAGFSALAAMSDSPGALIGWRAAMGIGAALMFPATLAILVNVFTAPKERATAIAVWAATAGLAVALGPVTGGFLLEHFWWGSVLMINVPVIAVALVAIALVVPTSRDTTIKRFDPLGTVLSIAGIGTLVWAVIEGPEHGWTSPESVIAFGLAALFIIGFVAWEQHTDHPMLDVTRVLRHALHRRQRRRDVRLLRPVRVRLRGHPVLPVRARLRHAGGRRAHRPVRHLHGVDGAARGEAGGADRHQGRGDRWSRLDGRRVRHRHHDAGRHAVRRDRR